LQYRIFISNYTTDESKLLESLALKLQSPLATLIKLRPTLKKPIQTQPFLLVDNTMADVVMGAELWIEGKTFCKLQKRTTPLVALLSCFAA
jgi:hypothetical protein